MEKSAVGNAAKRRMLDIIRRQVAAIKKQHRAQKISSLFGRQAPSAGSRPSSASLITEPAVPTLGNEAAYYRVSDIGEDTLQKAQEALAKGDSEPFKDIANAVRPSPDGYRWLFSHNYPSLNKSRMSQEAISRLPKELRNSSIEYASQLTPFMGSGKYGASSLYNKKLSKYLESDNGARAIKDTFGDDAGLILQYSVGKNKNIPIGRHGSHETAVAVKDYRSGNASAEDLAERGYGVYSKSNWPTITENNARNLYETALFPEDVNKLNPQNVYAATTRSIPGRRHINAVKLADVTAGKPLLFKGIRHIENIDPSQSPRNMRSFANALETSLREHHTDPLWFSPDIVTSSEYATPRVHPNERLLYPLSNHELESLYRAGKYTSELRRRINNAVYTLRDRKVYGRALH